MIVGIQYASSRDRTPLLMTGVVGLTPDLPDVAIKGKLENGLDEGRTSSSEDYLLKNQGLSSKLFAPFCWEVYLPSTKD